MDAVAVHRRREYPEFMRLWHCILALLAFGAAPAAADIPVPPPQWTLLQNDPDPVCPNPSPTRISFALAQAAHVQLVVLGGVSGPVLRTLIDSDLLAGFYSVVWDGRDAMGAALPDAIYPYQVIATVQSAVAFDATKFATLGCTVASERSTWSRVKALYE